MSAKKNNVIALNGQSRAPAQVDAKRKSGAIEQPLLKALALKAHEIGHPLTDMAVRLGVTYGFFAQLVTGSRKVESISDDFAAACATYLGVPRLQVLAMAGRIKPQDFFASEDTFRQELERAVKFIEADAKWAVVLTQELRASSLETLYGVVRLYEAATGTVLMVSRQDDASAPSD